MRSFSVIVPVFGFLCGAAALSYTASTSRAQPSPAPLWGESPATKKSAPVESGSAKGALPHYSAMGISVAESLMLGDLAWTDDELEAFIRGIRSAHRGETFEPDQDTARFLDEMNSRIQDLKKKRSEEYKNAMYQDLRQSFGLEQTDSGLFYRIVNVGAGPRPRKEDTVLLNIEARELDAATVLHALSVKQHRCKVTELLPGLAEGVQLLTLGSQAVFMLPPELSFGNRPWPEGVRRGVPILFMVQLLDVAAPSQ